MIIIYRSVLRSDCFQGFLIWREGAARRGCDHGERLEVAWITWTHLLDQKYLVSHSFRQVGWNGARNMIKVFSAKFNALLVGLPRRRYCIANPRPLRNAIRFFSGSNLMSIDKKDFWNYENNLTLSSWFPTCQRKVDHLEFCGTRGAVFEPRPCLNNCLSFQLLMICWEFCKW